MQGAHSMPQYSMMTTLPSRKDFVGFSPTTVSENVNSDNVIFVSFCFSLAWRLSDMVVRSVRAMVVISFMCVAVWFCWCYVSQLYFS